MARVVVTDTGPLNYLVLIGHIDLLPVLFNRMAISFGRPTSGFPQRWLVRC
jgi:hypothetical protein